MKVIAVSFFTNLFANPGPVDSNFLIPWLFPTINADILDSLCRPVDSFEVKSAMFSIGGLKTPGFDGFPALFYQTFWQIYASEVFSTVSQAFSSGTIPPRLNHTIISLIPKVPGPQNMVRFRPTIFVLPYTRLSQK